MTPLALKNALKKYTQPTLEKIVAGVILKDREILQVKFEELQAGTRPDGGPIGFYSNHPSWQWYAEEKNNRNPLPGYGVVDLIDTGSFAKGNEVISLGNGSYTIKSRDQKADLLIDKYGSINERINFDAWNRLQKFNYLPKVLRLIKI